MKKALLSLFLTFTATLALAWPTKDITLIVPFAAGGLGDTHARLVAKDLEDQFKVQVVVKNMPGGSNAVAMNHILSNPNDNHTFMWAMDDVIVGPYVRGSNDYEKFVVTNVVTTYPVAFFGGAGASVEKLRQQIKEGKTISVGNLGYNGYYHLWSTNIKGGAKINPIPYKGQAAMLPDVLSGTTDYGMSNLGIWSALVKEGKLVPVMVTTSERLPHLKDVPTFKELGFQGDPLEGWFGFATRGDTSAEAIEKFSSAVRATTVNNARIKEFANRGFNLVNYGPKESKPFIDKQISGITKFKFTKE